MEQLTKNQAVATSQEAVQNQNEPQLRDENAHNDISVHPALRSSYLAMACVVPRCMCSGDHAESCAPVSDRKSTRLNSSHVEISYAVFCLKKKNKIINVIDLEKHIH